MGHVGCTLVCTLQYGAQVLAYVWFIVYHVSRVLLYRTAT